MRKITLVFLALLVVLTSSAALADDGFTTIDFSNAVDGEQKTSFYCGEQIYAHVVIRDITFDELHHIEIIWRDPNGTDQEVIEKDLVADSSGEIVQYIWLKLHRPKGSSFFSLFDDTYGMTDFIGKWTLVVNVDNEERGQKPFEVYC